MHNLAMPAQAGIQRRGTWVPACAGTTTLRSGGGRWPRSNPSIKKLTKLLKTLKSGAKVRALRSKGFPAAGIAKSVADP